jgi:hypothetical protein
MTTDHLYSNDREPRNYKGFTCLRDNPDYLFWRVAEAPLELSGFFTTIAVLETAISDYLARQAKEDAEIPAIYRTADGLVLVRLRHTDEQAYLDAADFDNLLERGIPTDWVRNPSSYMKVAVRLKGDPNLTPIARLIVQAGEGTSVRYIDDNVLNLRRSNLLLSTIGKLPNNLNQRDNIL